MELPTTQKVVVNSIIQRGIDHDPKGYRIVWMDNRYACPELCVYLREQCNILSAGTCRKNRKGWEDGSFDLSKKTKEEQANKYMTRQ